MHPKDKARILDKLEGYSERKDTVRQVGAAQDYWVLNYVVSNSRLNRELPRSEVIAVINEWAGYEPPQSTRDLLERLTAENERVKKLIGGTPR